MNNSLVYPRMYIISFAATTTYVIYTNEVIWFLTRIKYDMISYICEETLRARLYAPARDGFEDTPDPSRAAQYHHGLWAQEINEERAAVAPGKLSGRPRSPCAPRRTSLSEDAGFMKLPAPLLDRGPAVALAYTFLGDAVWGCMHVST